MPLPSAPVVATLQLVRSNHQRMEYCVVATSSLWSSDGAFEIPLQPTGVRGLSSGACLSPTHLRLGGSWAPPGRLEATGLVDLLEHTGAATRITICSRALRSQMSMAFRSRRLSSVNAAVPRHPASGTFAPAVFIPRSDAWGEHGGKDSLGTRLHALRRLSCNRRLGFDCSPGDPMYRSERPL